MPLFDHFDILAPIYDRVIKPKPPQTIWELAQLPADGLLLDAGGGTGRVAQYMTEKAAAVIVADISCQMLGEARDKGSLHPVCSHTERFPFPDGSFARIIMVDALHHVCDQSQTIREMWRVLSPGGILLIEEPDIRTFGVKMVALGEKLALMRSHFLGPRKIVALFDFPDAAIKTYTVPGDYNVWVVAQKRVAEV